MRDISKVLVLVISLALLVLGLALSTPGAVEVKSASRFKAPGAPIAGWYWLKPGSGQYADWCFKAIPRSSIGDGKLYINIKPLVGNKLNAGSGWETDIKVEVYTAHSCNLIGTETPGKRIFSTTTHVYNFFRPRVEGYTYGIGYQGWARAVPISVSLLPKEAGNTFLIVRVRRIKEEHVGVNQKCLEIAYKKATGGVQVRKKPR